METTAAIAQPAPRLQWRSAILWLTLVAASVTMAAVDQHFGWLSRWSGAFQLPNSTLTLLLLALACEFMDAAIGMGYGTHSSTEHPTPCRHTTADPFRPSCQYRTWCPSTVVNWSWGRFALGLTPWP
jgi:hypothetical protein